MSLLYCSHCESVVVEDLPGWLACYCTSAKLDNESTWPDTWHDPGPTEPSDPREEALTAAERNRSLTHKE